MKWKNLTDKCKNCQWLRTFKTQQQQETQALREALELREVLEVVPILALKIPQQPEELQRKCWNSGCLNKFQASKKVDRNLEKFYNSDIK